MAEILGLAASVFAVIQVADRVISLCKHYIECVQDAPSDLRAILGETSTMKAILENIKFLVECDNGQSAMFDSLGGASGPVEGCHEAMKSLEALFSAGNPPPQGPESSKKLKDRARNTFATLTWPLKESKARKLMEDVARYKGTLVLALTADSAHLMRDLVQRTNRLQLTLSESERREVFKWLEGIDPSSLHHRAQANYEPGTCDWATRLPEWLEFLSGKENCLWIHGIPGAGKTILASQLIDKIEQHCEASGSERLMSMWYYCYFGHNQDESISLLKWILSRLCREANEISDHLWKLFKHGGTPSIKDLLIAIERELGRFDEVYITVDAIDESNPREDLLKVLRQLATEKRFNKIRLLLTSREYVDIETVMIEFSMSISMKNEFLDADIRLYTESRVKTEKRIKSWPAELRQETVEALSQGAQGMFRWVVCQIDALRRIRRREAIREALSRLPKTLDEAYDRIFEQIEDEDIPYVISAMKWLCFQAKVYAGEEAYVDMQTLGQAVDDDILGDNRQNPEGEELLHDTESLREICGCLITVTPTTLTNGNRQQRSHVSFAHYTVLEYLASNNRYSPEPFFALEKDDLVLDKAERIFARALCVSDDEFEEYGTVKWSGDEHHVITNLPNFGSYCAWVSIDIIICFDAILSKHSAFLCQVLDVLNADTASSLLLFSIWKDGTDNGCTSDYTPWSGSRNTIQWETMPDLEIQVLVRLLIFGSLHIPRALLERMEPQKAFQARLDFKYNFPYVVGTGGECDWHFQGTLTDCFAALFPAAEIDSYKLLIEAGAENFDPQGALIPFVPWHKHYCNCSSDWCVLEKLLSLGANPNASGCYITPLQIAVAIFDVEGVLALLQAGADPNAEGDAAASAWPDDKLLSVFNCLNGWRPLEICKHIYDLEMFLDLRSWSERNEDTKGKAIEAILLEYGAED